PRVGGQRLDIAALPFRVDGVEGEGGLPRAGQPGDHHQLIAGDLEVDGLEIVLAGPPDDDAVVGHAPRSYPGRPPRVSGRRPEWKRWRPQLRFASDDFGEVRSQARDVPPSLDDLIRPRQQRRGNLQAEGLAVLRLRTSLNGVGCSMGRSPGLAPFRILST